MDKVFEYTMKTEEGFCVFKMTNDLKMKIKTKVSRESTCGFWTPLIVLTCQIWHVRKGGYRNSKLKFCFTFHIKTEREEMRNTKSSSMKYVI